MKNKSLLTPTLKLTIAVCALLAAPGFYAQQTSTSDTIARTKNIEEVVMIGYGTAKKSDLTGSVSVVGGADLQKVPVPNIAEALTGKVAGLTVTTTEGSPDAEVNLKIRGGTSLSQSNSPLIIVDGFPVESLNDIPSAAVENITVLKDASSTAIYGSRGANGVILVTTKSGKGGKFNVSFNSFIGYKFLANKINVLSPYDYAKWQYEFASLEKDIPSYERFFGPWSQIGQYQGTEALDWQEKIYGRTGSFQNTDLGLRGGTDKLNFNVNLAHYNDDGIQIGSGYKRDNFLLNVKSKPSDKVSLAFTFRYANIKVDGSGANEQNEASSADSRLRNSVAYSPINIPGLVTENFDDNEEGYLVNPFLAIRDNDRKQEKRNYNIQGSFNWKVLKNLQFTSDVGMEFVRYLDYRYYGRSTYYAANNPPVAYQGLPSLVFGTREDKRFRVANTLSYDFKEVFGENHALKLMVGQEYLDYQRNDLTNVVNAFSSQFTFADTMNLTGLGTPQNVNNFYFPDDRLLSFFTRANYDFKNRYLFTATFRADGSSKFSTGNQWGFFPSAAFAWKMSEENFLNDVSWLKLLKMRLSYGEAGNNNIPTGQLIQNFQPGSAGLSWIDGVSNYLAATNVMANPDLKWETTVTQNAGLDYEILKGRISGTLDLYKNNTKDLLVQFPTPGSGYDFQYRNMGEIENKGIEASISIDALKKQDYNVNFAFNIGFNKNEIKSLGIMNDFQRPSTWNSQIGPDYSVNVGQPLGLIFGYQNDGRYEVSDFNYDAATGTYTIKSGVADAGGLIGVGSKVQPGYLKLKDLDGDGKITVADKTVIGDVNPKYTGGFVLSSTVKNFDLSAAFNFSVGNDVYNANKIEFTSATPSSPNGQYRNLSSEMADGIRWTNIDPNTGAIVTDPAALTALNANTTLWSPYMRNYVLTDWAVEDGSFLRLNTLTLGYSFPESLVTKLGLTKIRLYATGYNLLLLTNYSGLDPEVSTRRKTPYTPGVDSSAYPKSRQFIFGFNLNF